MRILALITDAFGGYGGIALYNRDVLSALCDHADISGVVAVPRTIPQPLQPLPEKLEYVAGAATGKVAYAWALLGVAVRYRRFDMILCSHLHLMPIAWLLKKIFCCPVILEVYGIDAWEPASRRISNRAICAADVVIAISSYTRDRFFSWASIPGHRCVVLPNAIHLELYGEGEKPGYLVKRYNLFGKRILLTLGRVVSRERAKGFDEIIDLLPELPSDIVYIIAGEGEYRPVLEKKVRTLHLEDRVVFTGMVDEAEKADLYRLADLYAMPSRGEGFGFVFLEAMACGTPVLASNADGSRDAVRNGQLGIVVNPDDPEEIKKGILQGLDVPRGVPEGLDSFSFSAFTRRLHALVNTTVKGEQGG